MAVADLGNFTRAAERLHVSQPALSQQLANLEREFGTRLIDRRSRGATLTHAGAVLLPVARRILNEVERARFEVHELEELRGGRVRLGTTPSFCTTLVADSLRHFHDRYPAVELAVEVTGSRSLVQQLGRAEIDLAVIHMPLLRGDPPLVTSMVLTEELVIATTLNDRSLTGDPVAITVLEDRPLVAFGAGYEVRNITAAACREAGFEPTVAVEGGQIDAVLGFVAAGLGVAVVPRMVLRGRTEFRAVPFRDHALTRTIALAHRADLTLSRPARAVLDTLLATASELRMSTDSMRR